MKKLDRKIVKAIAALKRAEKELMNASSLTVGLGKDCWLQSDAFKLSALVANLSTDFELFAEEEAR
jgi:hypothetical protein